MTRTFSLAGLFVLFFLAATKLSAQTVTWDQGYPKETDTPAPIDGKIECKGTIAFASGFQPTARAVATKSGGAGRVYDSACTLNMQGQGTGTFTATISAPNNAALPNGTYSVWVLLTLTNQSGSITVVSIIKPAVIASGQGTGGEGGSIAINIDNRVNKVKASGTYVTFQGWAVDKGVQLNIFPAGGGGTIVAGGPNDVTFQNGTWSGEYPVSPGTYKVSATIHLKQDVTGTPQLVSTAFVDVEVTAQ